MALLLLLGLGQITADFRSTTGCALNLEVTAYLLGALRHDADPQVSVGNELGIKAATIISDVKFHPIGLIEQRHVDPGRLGMFDHVVQSFLGDAIESQGYLCGQLAITLDA